MPGYPSVPDLGKAKESVPPPLMPATHEPPGLPELRTPRPALERSTRQLGVCQSACFPATSKNISPPTPPAAATSLSTKDPLPACPSRQGEPRGGSWSQVPHRHRGSKSSCPASQNSKLPAQGGLQGSRGPLVSTVRRGTGDSQVLIPTLTLCDLQDVSFTSLGLGFSYLLLVV